MMAGDEDNEQRAERHERDPNIEPIANMYQALALLSFTRPNIKLRHLLQPPAALICYLIHHDGISETKYLSFPVDSRSI